MAHPLNERTNTHIEYRTPEGYRMNRLIIGAGSSPDSTYTARRAAELYETGNTDVYVVTTLTQWRGKNGKETRTELTRVPVPR